MAKRTKTTRTVFQLLIKLSNVEPAIWRRLLVLPDIRLAQLHWTLNRAMGWTCSHLHSFSLRDRTFGDPSLDLEGELDFEDERKVTLESLVSEGQLLRYEYDFGDVSVQGWG
jgi:hypothetical protein